MQIQITEKRLSTSDPETGRHYLLFEGDLVTVPDALGKRWCDKGWGKDRAGKYASGERKAGAERLTVPTTTVGSKTRKKGG